MPKEETKDIIELKRGSFSVLLLVGALLLTSFSPGKQSEKPHIIFIMTDQHRSDALGCMGNGAVISPNIDKIADDGVIFINGYSSVPSCTPARAGLLTGMSPWHHGMLGYGRVARRYKYEMPRMLREAGYYTFGIGKMHWYPQKSLHGFHGTLTDESGRVEQNGYVSDYRDWFKLQAPGYDPDETGIGWNDHQAGVYQLDEKLHPTYWTGKTAVELIDNYALAKPLFLKVSFARPHSPYDPPQRYLDMYEGAEIPEPVTGDWSHFLDSVQGGESAAFGNFGIEHAIESRKHYYANITFIDEMVGEIIQALKEKGMYENSIICFTSDHGDMLGDHHHWRKTYAYEGSSNIPFIVKWPASKQGKLDRGLQLENPVELRDFLPTFLDAAAAEIPKEMDGLSLLKLIEDPLSKWRSFIDLEHATCYSKDNYWAALTDGTWKYIWFFRTGKEQLFNLNNDPGEITDLSGKSDSKNELIKWRKNMVNHLSERGDSFVKNGELVVKEETMLYSPNYPKEGRNDDVLNNEYPEYTKFNKLKITDIHPRGWIKTFLERQKSGLTGNISVARYPFDTKMWAAEKIKGSQKAWWPYEQTAYYIDGANRLGHLLNDDSLLQIAKIQTQYVLNHINPETGRVGTKLQDRWQRWPYVPFFRTFMTDYEVSGDRKIINALHKHYLTFTAKDFADDLELANVEELCWLYGVTKDKRLLDMAEEAYRLFKSDINYRNRGEGGEAHNMEFGSDRVPDMHGVVYLELVKIPAILYSHTGNTAYLNEAENGIAKMEKHRMLISGLPSSTEHFKGISDLAGHETCNTAVFPHTYGYIMRINGDAKLGDKIEKAVFNAGIGSITKDFKSHQYFSAPNQVLATLTSNLYGHHPARMAFAPGHDVECCTGNVNRFMPYYVEQMWLSTPGNGLVASLYGPSSVTTKVGGNQTNIEIEEKTDYPFSETINFKINTPKKVSFPFILRIPEWTDSPTIEINGNEVSNEVVSGTFHKIEREFSDGDVISLKVPMSVTTSTWPDHQIGVERGPLVYSYSIPKEISIVKDYEQSTEDFPAFEMQPEGFWNYALSITNGDITVEQTEGCGYPWDEGNAPIKLIVPAKKVHNWKMKRVPDHQLPEKVFKTPPIPQSPELNDEIEYIELVPYGSTTLRITVFPED